METTQYRLLRECLQRSSAKNPNKNAVIVEGEEVTYSSLLESSLKIATKLVSLGLEKGDRVIIYMDNTIPCITSLFGIMFAGGVFSIINPLTKRDKLKYIIEDSDAVVLFSDSHLKKHFAGFKKEISSLKEIVLSGDINIDEDCYSYDTITSLTPPIDNPVSIIPNDLAALIYTSGSTGNPKGVMQTNMSMLFALFSVSEYLRLTESEKIILFLPLAFDYGLYQLLMSVAMGSTLIVERSFVYPSLVYKRIEEHQVSVFPGVPTIYASLITSYKKSGLTFPSVKKITNTAAKLPKEYLSILKKIFPNALIFKMYGLTECKRVSYLEPELLNEKPDSVGKAIPGTEIFIKNKDGKISGPNEPGILFVRGPHVMSGYWKRPGLSEDMLKPGLIPGERILCTQDLMKMDKEGFLYFVGRTDDIIKTRGEKVSPVEIENILNEHNSVKESVVIGVPDDLLGEAIHAFVVLTISDDSIGLKLKKSCMEKLENFMVPQKIVILDKMPLTSNGKIDKKELFNRMNK